MNSYIGTKLIKAEVMNLGDYNKYKGPQRRRAQGAGGNDHVTFGNLRDLLL